MRALTLMVSGHECYSMRYSANANQLTAIGMARSSELTWRLPTRSGENVRAVLDVNVLGLSLGSAP